MCVCVVSFEDGENEAWEWMIENWVVDWWQV